MSGKKGWYGLPKGVKAKESCDHIVMVTAELGTEPIDSSHATWKAEPVPIKASEYQEKWYCRSYPGKNSQSCLRDRADICNTAHCPVDEPSR